MVLIAAFVLALVGTRLAMALARRVNLLDRPGDLKVQREPVPYLGGVGVAAGAVIGVALARPALLLPLGLALGLGILDDARGMSAVVRFVAEVAIGIVVGVLLPVRLPSLLGIVVVTIVALVLINGVNMIDGLDGLAGGVTLVSAVGFALILSHDGRTVALALAGGLGAFLVFNRPPARVYLGDGGSYLVGTALAVLLCLAWSSRSRAAVSAGALLLVACPVAELACAVLRRVRSRQPLFAGDRGHPYDRLVQTGRSPSRAVIAYVVAQALFTAAGVGVAHLGATAAITTAAVTILAIVAVCAVLAAEATGRSKAAA
jgi:UDP-GlcNAc:undecaprenyl-phosphate GlcNAc-1-phosphate transferase